MSSVHVTPLNPFGQLHLKLPIGNDVQVPPLRQGDEAHRFCFSQCFPKNLTKIILIIDQKMHIIFLFNHQDNLGGLESNLNCLVVVR